ncbi:hypothetical protein MY11210_009452 [Beauveria gryllotalpidicola]
MAAPPYIPTHDDDLLLPIEYHLECHSEVPPSSSSRWSGPCASAPSVISFHSSTATDSIWREPVCRLRRWKERVTDTIRLFQSKGKEGINIIQQQPLRVHGQYNELLMSDRTPLPDDLVFWKKSLAYLTQEGHKKFPKAADDKLRRSAAETTKPQWIYDWMRKAEAAQNAGRLDTTKEEEEKPAMEDAAAHEKPSPREQPVRRSARRHMCAGRQGYDRTTTALEEISPAQRRQEHKRLDADTDAEADQEQTTLQEPMYTTGETNKKWMTSTLKRPRLEYSSFTVQAEAPPPSKRQRQQCQPPIKHTAGKRQFATGQGLGKGETIAAVAKNRLSSRWVPVGRRDVCGPQAQAQTHEPLRRSLRIAARRKADGNRL